MAKKRKVAAAATTASQEHAQGLDFDPRESRKRIQTYEDVAGSDDEFHLNHDEIHLGEEPAAKRRRKIAQDEAFLEASDEEVLGDLGEEHDDDWDDDNGSSDLDATSGTQHFSAAGSNDGDGGDDEDGLTGWGTSKDALYGNDAIETEEQALEEEQEAIRLQKRQLQQMRAADYGFDDDDWQQDRAGEAGSHNVVSEVLPQLQIAPDLGVAERLKLLKSRYPEFEPLSKDLLQLQHTHAQLLDSARTSSVAQMKLRAASAYLGALVMYFSLLASSASSGDGEMVAVPAAQLREHPIMMSLVKCRELWTNVSAIPDQASTQDSDVRDNSSDEVELESDGSDEAMLAQPVQPTIRSSRAQRHAAAVQSAAEERRLERMRRAEADLAELDALVVPKTKRVSKASREPRMESGGLDLGEEAPLTAREAADKAQKKKSLRFYTSQIAQKANKRGIAGRVAGGDDDIPHRERLRDRQARLNAEAEKRGKRPGDAIGTALGDDTDEEDHAQAHNVRALAEDDEYYDLIAAKTSKKKSDKAALAEAQRQAALQGGAVVQQETMSADGKRKITYAIEKNKGLTPHRKKDVRNPRVKKRKKYDEKKKKLASIKPVYKGGEGRGGYGGELTGIKGSLVKSTKLS